MAEGEPNMKADWLLLDVCHSQKARNTPRIAT